MTLFGANNACWLRRTGWSTLEHSGGPKQLQEVQVEVFDPVWSCGGVPPILAQERPKRPILDQIWPKYNFEHSGDPKRLDGMAWSWNKLKEPVGRGGGVPLILSQKRPKRAKMAQKWLKFDFEHSGGMKRLERSRTKLE